MGDVIRRVIERQCAWHREVAPRSPEMLDYALAYAVAAHGDQLRKYTHDPYIVHPANVARLVGEVFPDIEMMAAAYLHDVLEDTPRTVEDVMAAFGYRVGRYVLELTDVFTDPKLHGNRETRKRKERERLANVESFAFEVQTIKVADLCDNTCSIVQHDPNFAKVYMREKSKLLPLLDQAHPELRELAKAQLEVFHDPRDRS